MRIIAIFLTLLFTSQFVPNSTNVDAFLKGLTSVQTLSIIKRHHVVSVKPDLFSDDLFDDDEDPLSKKRPAKKDDEPPKRKYLDQEWKLSPEDSRDFKGFPSKAGDITKAAPSENFPSFALMYKFRKEYIEVGIDAMLADHRGHCTKFKRLINSEVINFGNSRGVVLLWAGLSEDDKADTKADIMKFLEDDPLIIKDAIEKWDVIDLEKQKDLPEKLDAVAAA